MKIVYISAPYSATDFQQIEENIRFAEKIALFLVFHLKIGVILTHTMTKGWERLPIFDYEHIIAMDLELIKRCDAVLVVGNWQRSKGCIKEIMHSYCINKPVFYSIEDLINWLDKEERPDEQNL